jgi:predicted signal transduction protein with EAL and GGDEF domain
MISISASIGVAIYPQDEADADTLLRHADQAMYLAKQAGRNRFHWFDIAHDRQAQTSQQMLTRLREALRTDELCLHYQPKVNMRSGEVIGMDCLVAVAASATRVAATTGLPAFS